ncbi:acyl-CoA thioester hydrolase [Desulfuromusa kysingii]|uniref:Acyl-CoA thioester hydrolase n=1 Tax=Desulfuromusa kysingii TaxID=37625 RepID=A0A1H3VQT8_9BACT|nr:acyl-CoA thioesterase [Desulfuromusa kysingii]SDZ76604.1 acyl-CoA thioester hydrolase [Desulfuromusa kysingii]
MKKPYFRRQDNAPEPLRCRVDRVVRFEEVDALAIVWHGRYPSYFEDGRVLLGEKYGLGYMDFYHQGVIAPIKQIHVDYKLPLRFGDHFTIEALLHWTDATRLNHEFIIRNAAGEITTTGYSVQLLMDQEQNVLMLPPPCYEQFRQRWLSGELQ